jgi:hypothetical protein
MRMLVGGSPGTFGCHACYTGLFVISSVRPNGLTSQFLGWQVSVLPGSEASALVSVRLLSWTAAINRLKPDFSRINPGDWAKVEPGWLA